MPKSCALLGRFHITPCSSILHMISNSNDPLFVCIAYVSICHRLCCPIHFLCLQHFPCFDVRYYALPYHPVHTSLIFNHWDMLVTICFCVDIFTFLPSICSLPRHALRLAMAAFFVSSAMNECIFCNCRRAAAIYVSICIRISCRRPRGISFGMFHRRAVL